MTIGFDPWRRLEQLLHSQPGRRIGRPFVIGAGPISLRAALLRMQRGLEVHAAFCMYNRYVDGLAIWAPDDQSIHRQMEDRVVTVGYTQPGWEKPFSIGSRAC
jgi:hypothetical protein